MFTSFFHLRTLTLHYHGPDVTGHLASQKVRLRQHIARMWSESLRNRRFKMRHFLLEQMVMFIDLDISEASSETKEMLYSAWIWEACSLLVKLRKSYSVLGGKNELNSCSHHDRT